VTLEDRRWLNEYTFGAQLITNLIRQRGWAQAKGIARKTTNQMLLLKFAGFATNAGYLDACLDALGC